MFENRSSEVQRNKVRLLSTQQFDSFMSTMCKFTVLLLILTSHSKRV